MSNKEKILSIESQILQLQEKKKKVEKKRKDELADILERTGALELPDSVIVGALVDVLEKFHAQKKEVGHLESLGNKILNPGRGRPRKSPSRA